MNAAQVSFTRLDPRAYPPQRGVADDAGFDLAVLEPVDLEPGERSTVGTGLAIAIPTGWVGLVLPRSGHAVRHGIGLVNAPGLIDSGYRGEIRVVLINHGTESVRFETGERIAQLIILPVPEVGWIEVEELADTERGTGGFGSTGR